MKVVNRVGLVQIHAKAIVEIDHKMEASNSIDIASHTFVKDRANNNMVIVFMGTTFDFAHNSSTCTFPLTLTLRIDARSVSPLKTIRETMKLHRKVRLLTALGLVIIL